MDNIFKISKNTKAAVLAVLLLLSLALPLFAFSANAVTPATITLSPTSGPNGTLIKVTGTGFNPAALTQTAENNPFIVTIDGLGSLGVSSGKATTFGAAFTSTAYYLQTNASGYLTGYIIIGGASTLNLAPGAHTIQITDAIGVSQAVTFVITSPTLTVTPNTGPAGTSVKITATGYPTNNATVENGFTNAITEASFAGTLMPPFQPVTPAIVAAAPTTAVPSTGMVTAGTTYQINVATQTINVHTGFVGTGTCTIVPSANWAAAGTITGTFSVAANAPYAAVTVTGTFTGTIPTGSALIGTVNPLTITVTLTTPALPVQSTGAYTLVASALSLSSNKMATNAITGALTGGYTGTVSLPKITSGSAITLTDSQGNTGTAIFSLTAPAVTISPTSGPAGTLVTVNASGFGPGATFAAVTFGTTAIASIPNPTTVTEQGTAAFQFALPTSITTADFMTGGHTVTVTDSLGNAATATFSVVASATVTLGTAAVDSATPYAPAATALVVARVSGSGFRANAPITVTGLGAVPTQWTTAGGSFAGLVSNANGVVAVTVSAAGTTPASGTYALIISDGTSPVQVLLTIQAAGNFIYITPSTGAPGTTVAVAAFGTNTATITFDNAAVAGATQSTANAWPAAPTVVGSFTVPAAAVGGHSVSATGAAFNSPTFTVVAPSVNVVPTSGAVGTLVTIVGTGFANKAGNTLAATVDGITVTIASQTFTAGAVVATFQVPALIGNPHSIIMTDSSSNIAAASFSTIAASITISPTSGTVKATSNSAISITGSGFKGGDTISTVYFDLSSQTFPAATVGLSTTNTNGGIILYTGASGLTLPVTSATAGIHTVTLITASGAAASATFTVTPRVVLAPAALRAGETVVITGSGFAATSTQTLTLNGTIATWYDTSLVPPQTVATAPVTSSVGDLAANRGTVISSAISPGFVTVTVTDAAGNTQSANLTILASPSIALSAGQVIPQATVGIAGAGFSPGTARAATAQILSGATVISIPVLSSLTRTVSDSGTFGNTTAALNDTFSTAYPLTFAVPTGLAAGTYTLSLTLGAPGTTETASANFVILGAPTAVASPTTVASGSNVTLAVVGLTSINTATLGSINLVIAGVQQTTGSPAVQVFGPVAVPTRGANAYNLTTSFLVPTTLPAGSYSVVLSDTLGFSATALITITPAVAIAPLTAIKGAAVTITGTGFAASSTFTITFNGAAVGTVGATTGTGGVSQAFAVPPTAATNNTVTVTDLAGNSATVYLALTKPTLTILPTSGNPGTTVELIGAGFGASSLFVQVGGQIVQTAPIAPTGPSFVVFITIPANTPNGNTTITVTDALNNAASAIFTVGGSSGGQGLSVDTATLASTAATQTASGTASSAFARGTTVKFAFVLQSTTGSGNVVFRVTLKQPDQTPYVVSSTAFVSTTPTSPSATFPLLAGAPTGTWTAQVQIYAQDGITPLGATTLTFTVT